MKHRVVTTVMLTRTVLVEAADHKEAAQKALAVSLELAASHVQCGECGSSTYLPVLIGEATDVLTGYQLVVNRPID